MPVRVWVPSKGRYERRPSTAEAEVSEEHARQVRRRLAIERMSPREKQLAALEELRVLEEAARDMAAATTDEGRRAELLATAEHFRRTIATKEREMPAIDTERPAAIRAAFTAKVETIRAEFTDLARDDGRDPKWKNRRRTELTRDLEYASKEADEQLAKWATAAAREAQKGLNVDSRTPEDVMKDMATEMRASRLAATITSTGGAARIEAENKLMAKARQLRSVDFRQALSYAQAAAQHGAFGADSLAAELEGEYRATWPGHADAAQLVQTVERELDTWRTASASAMTEAGRSAIVAARATGDLDGASRLSDQTTATSISAKLGAWRSAQRDGVAYADPIGPDTTPTADSQPVHSVGPTILHG